MAPQGIPGKNWGYEQPGQSIMGGEYDLYSVRMRRIWRPPTDVYETEDHIIVKVEIPGMRKEDFEITLADRQLVIAGHRRFPEGKCVYHNMEIHYGAFRTEVRIDRAMGDAPIEATYENGFLFVRLPKAEKHRIQVRVAKEEDQSS